MGLTETGTEPFAMLQGQWGRVVVDPGHSVSWTENKEREWIER